MIGKDFRVGSEVIKILDIAHSDYKDLYRVTTASGVKKVSATELLNDYVDVNAKDRPVVIKSETNKMAISNAVHPVDKVNLDSNMSKMAGLADILFANIEKVREDPKYIAQAEAVNESAKQLISLSRLQIEMIKFAKNN